MTYLDKIYKYTSKVPYLSSVGFVFINKYWKLKSNLINYEFKNTPNASITKEQLYDYNQNRIFGPQKRFCYAPFNNLHFKINGDVTLCSFNHKLSIGNVNNDSLINIWNSQKAANFRDMMADYDLSHCLDCKLAFSYKNYSSLPTTKYDYYADNEISYPNQMSFEISNLCNLECIMCDEDLSSAIRKTKGLAPLKNVYTEDFLIQLQEFIPHLKIATFIGGEPVLIKLYYKIWEAILKHNPSCEIHVQTNATILPEKFLTLLESKKFSVGISLDAISKDTFESIRLTSNHTEIFNNVALLINYYKRGVIGLNINFCLMNMNWQELPLMLKFCNENNISLKIIHVNGPFHVDIKNLHSDKIQYIYNKLSDVILSHQNNIIVKRNNKMYQDTLKNLIQYIEYADNISSFFIQKSKNKLEELTTEIHSIIRNNSLFAVYDEQTREDIFQFIVSYLNNIHENEDIKKNVCIRIIYHFLKNEHMPLEKEANYVLYKKILDGYLKIETYNS